MKISADFNTITGTIKPMHAVGQPPTAQLGEGMMHYLTEAGIPYSRLHDVQGTMGANLYVDIPNIFRNFDADVNDPASYDFTFTDHLLNLLYKYGVTPFYRLGVTIENYAHVKSFRIMPPADFQKWAEICEHIIRHYNEGWANGFHHNLTYWEIWNEPDASGHSIANQTWRGTPERFYEFYTIAATHLKKCFGDSIQVGGYAGCGFYNWEEIDPDCNGFTGTTTNSREGFIKFGHEFLQYVREHNAPLDFFSWHTYSNVLTAVGMARYTRRVLEKYGFGNVPDILNEWNTCHDPRRRSTDYAAAQAFGMMLSMQKESPYMLNFYDARFNSASQYGGLFNPDKWEPYLTYYGFMSFNEAYKLKNEAKSDTEDPSVPVCAAVNGDKKVLLISNMKGEPVKVEFDIAGADTANITDMYFINEEYKYSPTHKKILDNAMTIPKYTCVEIRFA